MADESARRVFWKSGKLAGRLLPTSSRLGPEAGGLDFSTWMLTCITYIQANTFASLTGLDQAPLTSVQGERTPSYSFCKSSNFSFHTFSIPAERLCGGDQSGGDSFQRPVTPQRSQGARPVHRGSSQRPGRKPQPENTTGVCQRGEQQCLRSRVRGTVRLLF